MTKKLDEFEKQMKENVKYSIKIGDIVEEINKLDGLNKPRMLHIIISDILMDSILPSIEKIGILECIKIQYLNYCQKITEEELKK